VEKMGITSLLLTLFKVSNRKFAHPDGQHFFYSLQSLKSKLLVFAEIKKSVLLCGFSA
jgi:hypothetical protein